MGKKVLDTIHDGLSDLHGGQTSFEWVDGNDDFHDDVDFGVKDSDSLGIFQKYLHI